MSQAPFWPVATDAFIADTTHLTAEQTGAYMMLLMCSWRSNGKPLPLEHKKLCRMARVSPGRWPKIWEEIQDFFIVENGMVIQNRLCKDWVTVQEKITRNRQSGSLGGKAKALKIKEMELANAIIPPKRNSTNQNHNHKDIKDIDKSISKKPPSKKGTRIDGKFKHGDQIPNEYIEAATKKGLGREKACAEFEKFVNHWTAASGSNAVKRSWIAAWRNWVTRSIEWSGNNGPNRNGPSGSANASPIDAANEIIAQGLSL